MNIFPHAIVSSLRALFLMTVYSMLSSGYPTAHPDIPYGSLWAVLFWLSYGPCFGTFTSNLEPRGVFVEVTCFQADTGQGSGLSLFFPICFLFGLPHCLWAQPEPRLQSYAWAWALMAQWNPFTTLGFSSLVFTPILPFQDVIEISKTWKERTLKLSKRQ